MSDEKKKMTAARAAIALFLFVVGGWYCVSSLMAVFGSAPHASALTKPVVVVMAWIGVWPTLAASLGLAVVGAWSFLVQDEDLPWVPNAIGAVGIGLGLALGLGAFLPDGGGELGAVLPSLLPGGLGLAAGAAVGLAVLLATAWMAWLPADAGFSGKPGEPGRLRAAGSPEEGDDGVSSEEARALIAEPPRPTAPSALPRTPSQRDDVRTRGGVPEGTRPLPSAYDRPPQQAPDHALQGGEAPAAPRSSQPAGKDLAAPGAQSLRAGGLLGRQARPEEPRLARPAPAVGDAQKHDPALAVPVQPSWERAREAAAPEEEPAPVVEEGVLAPEELGAAWEALDGVPPGSAWEAEANGRAALADDEEEDELVAEDEDEELEDEDELLSEADEEPALAAAGAGDEEELEDEDDELEEEDEAEEEELVADLDDEEDEVEEEEVPIAATLAEVEEPGVLELLEPQAEAHDEPPVEPLEPSVSAPEPRPELEPEPAPAAAEEPAPAEEPSPEPAAKRPRKKRGAPAPAPVQSGLFDEARPAAEELAVVEIPAAPPPAAAAAARAAAGPSDLLLEAGNLILEQNRVAVSMLQRRFGLDFDAATEVLDQLQGLGLIGPYLGGKTRDILLSREEWMALAHGV